MKKLLFIIVLFPMATIAQWNQKGQNIFGTSSGDLLGDRYCIALNSNGNSLVVGSIQNYSPGTGEGYVRVYDYIGNLWVQKGSDFQGQQANDFAGYADISDNGNVIVIGARGSDVNGNNSGKVTVFEWNGSNWQQKGGSIFGEGPSHDFGVPKISGDGNTIAVGSEKFPSGTEDNFKIYTWNGSSWQQKGNTIIYDDYSLENIEFDLSNDGNTIIIGDKNRNSGIPDYFSNAGQIVVYNWNGSDWSQKGVEIVGTTNDQYLGNGVTIDGTGSKICFNSSGINKIECLYWSGSNWLPSGMINIESGFDIELSEDGTKLLSSNSDDNTNGIGTGRISAFEWNGSSWIQYGQDLYGVGGNYGFEIAMSGDGNTISAGARFSNNGVKAGGEVITYNYSGTTYIEKLIPEEKHLTKIIDLMGRETTPQKNKVLIYIFSDGTTERIFEFENY